MLYRLGVLGLVAILTLACGGSTRQESSGGRGGDGWGGGVGPDDCVTTDPCRESRFDEEEGRCVAMPREGSCDDGDACTTRDRCVEGSCTGEPRDCDDALGCTLDRCEPGLGCVHETDAALCDDGDDCTSDLCTEEGDCAHEPLSGNLCGDSDCVAEAACDDGACVSRPADSAGVCYPESIDFGDVIVGVTAEETLTLEGAEGAFRVTSIESIHPDVEVAAPSLPRNVDAGESLDLDVAWTPSAEGRLRSTIEIEAESVTWHVSVLGRALPQPDCDDDNPCTADAFDTSLGACVNEPMPAAPCSDDNACTVADACNEEGECVPGDYLECPDGEVCKAGTCEERLCLDPAKLAPVCANVAVPLGEGCLCQLVYEASTEDVRQRMSAMLMREYYDQKIITVTFLGQVLTSGLGLNLREYPQRAQVDDFLALVSRWDSV